MMVKKLYLKKNNKINLPSPNPPPFKKNPNNKQKKYSGHYLGPQTPNFNLIWDITSAGSRNSIFRQLSEVT